MLKHFITHKNISQKQTLEVPQLLEAIFRCPLSVAVLVLYHDFGYIVREDVNLLTFISSYIRKMAIFQLPFIYFQPGSQLVATFV